MAWESGIAYNAALADATREALEAQSVEWLAQAIANDRYERMFPGLYNPKWTAVFDRWVSQLSSLPHDILVDDCMRRAERTDTADNGGSVIWIDKSGCSKVELA